MQQCFEEACKPFDEVLGREKKMTRDDYMHGSLLIINELLRCSNNEAEVRKRFIFSGVVTFFCNTACLLGLCFDLSTKLQPIHNHMSV